MDEVENFCQFPNPWALRVSGMGGYTSKCEKSQNHRTLLLMDVRRTCPACLRFNPNRYGLQAMMGGLLKNVRRACPPSLSQI